MKHGRSGCRLMVWLFYLLACIAPAILQPSSAEGPSPVLYGLICKGGANVRAEADAGSAVIAQLRSADIPCVILRIVEGADETPTWYHVALVDEAGLVEGYVRGDSVQAIAEAEYRRCVSPEQLAAMVWIPTKGGTKHHANARCSGMISPRQVPLDEAYALGFSDACKRCHAPLE